MNKSAVRIVLSGATAIAMAGALAACGGSGSSSSSSAPSAAAGGVDLSGVCPATIVIQTDWNPEGEHGHLYELLGTDYTVDANKKSVSGPLLAQGEPTGVNVEIRSGGPAIGYQTVTSQMYQDKSITLGYVTTDEAVQLSDQYPTTAVFAPLEKGPQMIMWDPETYPDVTDIASLSTALAANDGVIRYFGGAAYMEYLMGAGIVDPSVADGTYDGTPAKFVASKGKDAQQGFASAEPYIYENEVPAWGKPVAYQLVHDTGYPVYASAVSVRSDELESLSSCLAELVPVLQQAEVDYFDDPTASNELILDLVTQFNNGWVYGEGVADYAVTSMKDEGLVSNGDNDYMGDFDETRIQTIIDLDTPIFTAANSAPKEGLKATDLFTNEFIDQSIGF